MTTAILAVFVLISIVLAVFQAPAPNGTGGFATGENMAAVGALALYLGIPVHRRNGNSYQKGQAVKLHTVYSLQQR